MKSMKNEKGYAMLIVLFLIVFITILSSVFMRNSISNTKQENVVDANQLSIVAAEMGVEYYNYKYNNKFNEVKNDIWEEHRQDFLEDKNAMKENNSFKYEERVADEILKRLSNLNHYEGMPFKKNEISYSSLESTSFKELSAKDNVVDVVKHKVRTENGKKENYIQVSGYVEGKYDNKNKKELKINLIFIIPSMLQDGIESNENSGLNKSLQFPNKPSFSCKGDYSKGLCIGNSDQIEKITNAKIYYTNNQKFNGAMALKSIGLYIEGNVEGIKIRSSNKVEVYAKESLVFDDFNINNSVIYSGNDMEGKSANTDVRINNSVVFVGDNYVQTKGNFILSGNSRMCVVNDFIHSKQNGKKFSIDSGSILFVTKPVVVDSGVSEYLRDGRIKIVSSKELKGLCASEKMNWSVDWPTEIDVKY